MRCAWNLLHPFAVCWSNSLNGWSNPACGVCGGVRDGRHRRQWPQSSSIPRCSFHCSLQARTTLGVWVWGILLKRTQRASWPRNASSDLAPLPGGELLCPDRTLLGSALAKQLPGSPHKRGRCRRLGIGLASDACGRGGHCVCCSVRCGGEAGGREAAWRKYGGSRRRDKLLLPANGLVRLPHRHLAEPQYPQA